MTVQPTSHPLDRLSKTDRRRWRRLGREARAALDAQQLRRLRGLAGAGAPVVAAWPLDAASPWVTVMELHIAGWRLVGRMAAGVSATLGAALARGPVRLAAAGRYGPYWTLTFAGRGAPLAVLADGLVVTRGEGGPGDKVRWPELELLG